MNDLEKKLLSEHLNFLKEIKLNEKDKEADALIQQAFPSSSDALYILVQRSLIQSHALADARKRIDELSLPARKRTSPIDEPSSNAGFASKLSWVPKAHTAPVSPPQTTHVESGLTQNQQHSSLGSFLSSTAATAVGIAGGSLLYDLVRNLISPTEPVSETSLGETESRASTIEVTHSSLHGYNKSLSHSVLHQIQTESEVGEEDEENSIEEESNTELEVQLEGEEGEDIEVEMEEFIEVDIDFEELGS